MSATKTAASIYVSGHCGTGHHDRCLGAYAGVDCTCPHHREPVTVAVHCFFGCEYVARSEDPWQAHDDMEQHYRTAHWSEIRRLVGWVAS